MCKTCQGHGEGGNDASGSSGSRKSKGARMSFPDDRKKGMKGDHKGLAWKQAIKQTAIM